MSSEEKFLARWECLEAAYFKRIAAVTEPFPAWRDRFRAGAAETARLVETDPAAARLVAVDALAAGEVGQRCLRRFASRLSELLDTARGELADPELVPPATASWIVAIFFARVHRRCIQPEGPDLPTQLPELMFLAISAYFGTEAGLQELVPPP